MSRSITFGYWTQQNQARPHHPYSPTLLYYNNVNSMIHNTLSLFTTWHFQILLTACTIYLINGRSNIVREIKRLITD